MWKWLSGFFPREGEGAGFVDGGESATIPTNSETVVPVVPDATDTSVFNLLEHIPEEFKDKPYLKGVDDLPKLFSKLDGSQELIGQREGKLRENFIPSDDASEEEKKEFLKLLGVPEEAAGYDFSYEGRKTSDEWKDFDEKVKVLAHKHGLSKKQAEGFFKDYEGELLNVYQESVGKGKEQAVNFEELADKTFTDRKQKVMELSTHFISENLPEGFGEHFDKLPNEALVLFAGVMDNMVKRYVREDQLPNLGEGGGSGQSYSAVQTAMRELIRSKEYKDNFHREHQKTRDRVRGMAQEMARLEKIGLHK